MWTQGWRDRTWYELNRPWDLIVIGGGITGAGILREATRSELRTLLVEQRDFASGTSSRSSKLVHGGLRYLRNAQVRLTFDSVRERERLLREGRGLISQMGFLMPGYAGDRVPSWIFGMGLILYDFLALKWGHKRYDAEGLRELCPQLASEGLLGGYRFLDAQTDDARLVLRLILESVQDGGVALNYAGVEDLLRLRSGEACGVVVRDSAPEGGGRTIEVRGTAIINATGAWADGLRQRLGARRRLRKLRGGHLIFPFAKLPLTRAVSVLHPDDGRPVFAFPWEGVTLVGTTDVEHGEDLALEPSTSREEAEYLLRVTNWAFPSLELCLEDAQGTFAGVRAVVDTGKANPSKESREHVLWNESNLLTVTGGKLTTFRLMAHAALRAIRSRFSGKPPLDPHRRMLEPPPSERCIQADVHPGSCQRLLGRYGSQAPALVAAAHPGELEAIGGGPWLWAELRWAARSEGVVHLDDLLLRRVRLGLTLPLGGLPWMDRVRSVVQRDLEWDNERWERERGAYERLWTDSYRVPGVRQEPVSVPLG